MAPSIGGENLDTIARMLLDTSQYEDKLIDVGKAIRRHRRALDGARLAQEEMDKATEGAIKEVKNEAKAHKEAWLAADKHRASIDKLKAGMAEFAKQKRITQHLQMDRLHSALDKTAQSSALDVISAKLKNISSIDVTKITRGLGVMTAALGAATVGFAAIINKGQEMEKLWQGSVIDIGQARDSVKGFISDQQLLKAANKASVFELGLTNESFAELSKGAVIASQKIGGDVVKAVDDLMTGMARMSKPILDNLGIQLSLNTVYSDAAKQLGKNVKELNEYEKKQAFVNAAIKDLKRIAGDTTIETNNLGDSYVAMKTAAGNASDATARFFSSLQSGSPFLASFANLLNDITESMNRMSDPRNRELIKISNEISDMSGEMERLSKEIDFVDRSWKKGESFFRTDEKLAEALSFRNKYLALQRKLTSIRSSKEKEAADNEYAEYMKGQKKIADAQMKAFEDQQARLKAQSKRKSSTKSKDNESQIMTAISVELETMGLLVDIYGKKIQKTVMFWDKTKSATSEVNSKIDDMTAHVALFEESRAAMAATEGMSFAKTILPDEDYDSLLTRMSTLGETWKRVTSSMMDGAAGLFKAVSKGLWSAISGTESFGDAMKKALSSFLDTFGEKMLLLALEEAAMTIKSLASGDYPGAAQHAAAAVAFGAAAAAAGVAANYTSTKATTSSASSTNRGLGGAASATTPQGGQITNVFNINSIGDATPELARIVADANTMGRNMGLVGVGV